MISARIDRSQASEPSDQLKASLCSNPSLIEPDLHLLDTDLQAGPAGRIDLVARDRAGSMVLAAIAGIPSDDALLRLIDQFSWVLDQRDLLERLYASEGVRSDRPIRALLIAPAISPAFLRRLSFLNFNVTAYLARTLSVRGEATLVVEPAAPLFDSTPHPAMAKETGAVRRGREPALITRTHLEIENAQWSGAEPAVDSPGTARDMVFPLPEIAPEENSDPADRSEWDTDSVESSPNPEPAGALETLTAEELEEFARFDRMRRERGEETP